MPVLTSTEIQERLLKSPDWALIDSAIQRTFTFKDFIEAMKFVNHVAELAESEWHHPDIDVRWNKVSLTLSTHSEGGLTQKDFSLAQQIDRIAR